MKISGIHYHISEFSQKKFEDPTPTPSATKFCEHKKGTWKTANFCPLFLEVPISFKKAVPYLNIDLGWWNFQKLMRTYLSWSGKNLVGETLFLHGQNFANMFYFHLFSAWTVIVSWRIHNDKNVNCRHSSVTRNTV